MMLTDQNIEDRLMEGDLEIHPLDDPERQIQPASIDLRLSPDDMASPVPQDGSAFDPEVERGASVAVPKTPNGYFLLKPNMFVLASTKESVTIPDDMVGRIEGRSSIGRIGVQVHATAGYCDPGFSGQITLEISNLHNDTPVRLYPDMYIAQLTLMECKSPAERPYGVRSESKYQGQTGPTGSRLADDFEKEDRS